MRLHGETLQSEEVCLKVVNGVKWKIGLEKSNQKVWLEKGWAEFVKFYSIDINFFVVFQYNGHSCFHVLIFDKTATGIQYPSASRELNKNISEHREREENGCFQILGNNQRSKKEDKTQILHSPTPKTMKRSDQACGSKVISKKVELKKDHFHSSDQLNIGTCFYVFIIFS